MEIVVPTSEVDLYRERCKNPIVEIPDEIEGLGRVRNWVLRHFTERSVIMVDDDIHFFYRLTGRRTQAVKDPDEVMQILINTCIMSRDLGTSVFGFAQSDIRKYKGTNPFSLCTWVGTIIGVNGRKLQFRDDKFKVDIDFCLQSLLVDRVVWVDNRYYASNSKDNNSGGNSKFRTEEAFNRSVQTLIDKWGDAIKVGRFQSQIRINLNVKRKQSLTIC